MDELTQKDKEAIIKLFLKHGYSDFDPTALIYVIDFRGYVRWRQNGVLIYPEVARFVVRFNEVFIKKLGETL